MTKTVSINCLLALCDSFCALGCFLSFVLFVFTSQNPWVGVDLAWLNINLPMGHMHIHGCTYMFLYDIMKCVVGGILLCDDGHCQLGLNTQTEFVFF